MPYQLVVVKGRSANQALPVASGGVTTVGRMQGCQIRIASSQVSRKHCEFFEKKGHLIVKDLGSSNGTFVNGKRIEGQQVLEPGNVLMIGSVVFRVEQTDAPAPAPDAAGRPSDTAVAQPVAVGGQDLPDYEIEADSETRVSIPSEAAEVAEAAEVGAATGQTAIAEDDVVDFLLDLDVDEGDKR